MALLYAMVLGADSIDDTAVLRAGRTGRLLGGWIPAPSTLGTFLRAFTFGHVRQLDALLDRSLERPWKAGAGPGADRLVIDVDSFVGEVCGRLKQGAGYGYTRVLGYHPLLATRGRHTRDAAHPAAEGLSEHAEADQTLLRRADRPGRTGRRDRRQTAPRRLAILEQQGLRAARAGRLALLDRGADDQDRPWVEAIDEHAWQPIDYPDEGEAQIAQTVYGERRLIVRRTRLLGAQAELWPDWRHFCLISNRDQEITLVEAEHRQHAVVEQVITDPKEQALAHFPSGHFYANSAWTVLAALAPNMLRWTQRLGLPDTTVRAARTLRHRLLTVPGRLTRHARGWTFHLPARWPWHSDYSGALNRIRALPGTT